jgi:predicted nucleotidyltransferase
MTNTSNPPLEIWHDRIDPLVLEAIRKIDEGRRTMDVDLGIALRDWHHFQALKSARIEQRRFQPHARMVQRLIYLSKPSVVVDLFPLPGPRIQGTPEAVWT